MIDRTQFHRGHKKWKGIKETFMNRKKKQKTDTDKIEEKETQKL
jgi:hypothetical protein